MREAFVLRDLVIRSLKLTRDKTRVKWFRYYTLHYLTTHSNINGNPDQTKKLQESG